MIEIGLIVCVDLADLMGPRFDATDTSYICNIGYFYGFGELTQAHA